MIFTYKCIRCARLFQAEPREPNGIARKCFKCMPVEKIDIEL